MSNASIIVSASNNAFFRNSAIGDALFYTQSNVQNLHIGVNSNAPAAIVISSNVNRIIGSNLSICSDNLSTSNLIAYYPFDTNANDAAGNYHLNQIGAPSFQPGRFNNGAYFPNPSNGAGYEHSWFESTAIGSAVTGPPCTFACWFNFSAAVSGSYQPVIFALGSNISNPSLTVNINPSPSWMIVTVNTGTVSYPVNNYALSPNTWYHLAITYNNSNIVTYVNGSSINSTALAGNFAVSGANSRLRIGAMGNTAGNSTGFNGTIDDFRVYNRALSAAEVSTLCASKPNVSLSVTGSNAGLSNCVGVLTPNAQQALEVGGNIVCSGNVSAGNLGMFRNRIINGDMRIAQRGTTGTVTSAGVPYLSLDRWFIDTNVSAGGISMLRYALSAVTDAATCAGLQHYMRIQGTGTQTYSWVIPTQSIEGLNVADLNWGTQYGSYVTLSLWLRSNLAAGSQIGVAIRNAGNTCFVANVTITQPAQWQYYTIVVPPPPTGSTWDATTSTGIRVCIGLAIPSGTATANVWNQTNNLTTSASANPYTNSTNYVDFTGVQLEKGAAATPFEFRPYAIELQLCQRYYQRFTSDNNFSSFGPLVATAATSSWLFVSFPVKMRTPITGYESSAVSTFQVIHPGAATGNGSAPLTLSFEPTSISSFTARVDVSHFTVTPGQSGVLRANGNNNAFLAMVSEL